MKPIDPIALAYKLDTLNHQAGIAAEELKLYPRRREAMFFLQEMSCRPGGIDSVVDRMVNLFPDAFVTEAMRGIGAPRGGRYTLGECLKVWKQLEGMALARGQWQDHPGTDLRTFHGWLEAQLDGKVTEAEVLKDKGYSRAAIMEGVKAYNWDFLRVACQDAAREKLPRLLRNFCEHPDAYSIPGDWFCQDIETLLERFMDHHAKEAAASIADTAVMRLMSEEIETAEATRLPVVMRGESGVGKSTVARALCEMRPGRRRCFEPKPGLDMRSLLFPIAGCLGIDLDRKWLDYQLSSAIGDVLPREQDSVGL